MEAQAGFYDWGTFLDEAMLTPILVTPEVETAIGKWLEAYEYDPTCKVFRAKVFNMAAYMKNATPIDENHKAFKMAKNMMATYTSGEHQFSARLREVVAKTGVDWLDQNCTKLLFWGMTNSSSHESSPGEASPRLSRDSSNNQNSVSKPSEAPAAAKASTPSPKRITIKLNITPKKAAKPRIKLTVKQHQPPQKIKFVVKGKNDTEPLTSSKKRKVSYEPVHNPRKRVRTPSWSTITGLDREGNRYFGPNQNPPASWLDSQRGDQDDLESFPDYVEPSLDELGIIAQDILNTVIDNQLHGFETTQASSTPSTPTKSSSDSDEESALSASSSSDDSDESITNVRPLNQKPSFKFDPSTSSIASKLPSFLEQLKRSNDELLTGGAPMSGFELDNEDEEPTGEHIEMNLGLGVLEERIEGDDSDEEHFNLAT